MSWTAVVNSDRFRAHYAWASRGRTGEGRLVLEGEDLQDARTNGKDFSYSKIHRCTFDGAEMVYSIFDGGEIRECSVLGSTFQHARFRDARIERTRFEGADLRESWFLRAQVEHCNFDTASLRGGNFVSALVADCSFRGANLEEVQLDKGQFRHCDFRDAKLGNDLAHDALFEDCDFRGADFDRRRLKDTVFTRCKFAGITGMPTVEGAYSVIDPDFSINADGSDVRSSDVLKSLWTKEPAR